MFCIIKYILSKYVQRSILASMSRSSLRTRNVSVTLRREISKTLFHMFREHKRVRSTVERTIGQLKRRWACLHGELRLSPAKASQVITACCVLYNLSKDFPPAEEVFEGKIVYVHIMHSVCTTTKNVLRCMLN